MEDRLIQAIELLLQLNATQTKLNNHIKDGFKGNPSIR